MSNPVPPGAGFRVRNGSTIPAGELHVSITKVTHPGGSDAWFPMPSSFASLGESYWVRNGWETVVVEHKQTGQRQTYRLDCTGTVVDVVFTGFSGQLNRGPGLWIRAASAAAAHGVRVFVSKYSGGSDDWFPLATNYQTAQASFWSRKGWDVVVFEEQATGRRRGWYLNARDSVLEVTFAGFEQDLGINRIPIE